GYRREIPMRVQTRKCEYCGKEFEAKWRNSRDGWPKYCSRSCVGRSQRRGYYVSCKNCGKEFYIAKAHKKREGRGNQGTFCSRKCKSEWQTQFTGELNPNWKGGRFKRSDGYIAVNVGNGEYRLEHVLIMEEII